MEQFDGSLRLAGTRDSLNATFAVTGGALRITAGEFEIGNWPLQDVRLTEAGDSLHILVEGEDLVVKMRDPGGFTEAVGVASPPPAKMRRRLLPRTLRRKRTTADEEPDDEAVSPVRLEPQTAEEAPSAAQAPPIAYRASFERRVPADETGNDLVIDFSTTQAGGPGPQTPAPLADAPAAQAPVAEAPVARSPVAPPPAGRTDQQLPTPPAEHRSQPIPDLPPPPDLPQIPRDDGGFVPIGSVTAKDNLRVPLSKRVREARDNIEWKRWRKRLREPRVRWSLALFTAVVVATFVIFAPGTLGMLLSLVGMVSLILAALAVSDDPSVYRVLPARVTETMLLAVGFVCLGLGLPLIFLF